MSGTSMDQTWDELFRLWSDAGQASPDATERWMHTARKRIARNTADDWRWLTEALADPGRMSFVASIFKVAPVPRRLLVPMVRAAVLSPGLTAGRFFVVPAVKSLGLRPVLELLLRYMESGTDAEKAGAVSALYYAVHNPRNEDLAELWKRIEGWKLREFVGNPDLDLRRRIIPSLELKPEAYPEDLRPLVPVAIGIARSVSDEYIRHRVERQLGASGPFMPIPPAGTP